MCSDYWDSPPFFRAAQNILYIARHQLVSFQLVWTQQKRYICVNYVYPKPQEVALANAHADTSHARTGPNAISTFLLVWGSDRTEELLLVKNICLGL